jgi:sugar phosphate isomerase/epimerase
LIVFGGRPGDDLAGVLHDVAQAGYDGFEAGNLFAGHDRALVEDLLAETGLAVTGTHTGYGDCKDARKVEVAIEYLQAVGSKYYIISGVAEGEGLEKYELAAETFNNLGAMLKDAGITFCYHNHAFEFEAFDGVLGIHRLCELMDPAVAKLCVDVYWVAVGGENPGEFVRRYSTMAPYYHFKDGAPGEFVELGLGTVDLPGSLAAARAAGAEWIVVEQDVSKLSPAVSVALSRGYLRGLGL